MERKEARKRPSCLGCILLMAVIVVCLKYVYWKYPKEPAEEDAVPAESEQQADPEDGLPLELPFSGWLDRLAQLLTGESASEERRKEQEEIPPLSEALYDSLNAGEDAILFGYDCTGELFGAFRKICEEHPELFWLDGGGRAETTAVGNDITVTFRPDFLMAAEEIPEARARLTEAVRSLLSSVPEDASDYEKILTVHDRLVTDTEYDQAAAARFTDDPTVSLGMSAVAYGCLVNRLAVCSGYAAAFRLLMNELGIPCLTVTGYDRESGMPHAWNCVSLEGDWYCVDVTWDDPAYADEGEFDRGVSRECFLITTEELCRTHIIGENQDPPDCTAVTYNYYVKNGLTALAYSFESAAAVLESQLGERMLCVKFPDEAEAAKAASELFDGQRFYEIVPEAGSVRYSIGRTGLLSIWPE